MSFKKKGSDRYKEQAQGRKFGMEYEIAQSRLQKLGILASVEKKNLFEVKHQHGYNAFSRDTETTATLSRPFYDFICERIEDAQANQQLIRGPNGGVKHDADFWFVIEQGVKDYCESQGQELTDLDNMYYFIEILKEFWK